MNIGALGIIGSAAGSPLAQSRGTDVDKGAQDTSDQSRRAEGEKKAEMAAGIGLTEEEQEASDRDADGRRPWEIDGGDAGDIEEDGDGRAAPPTGRDPQGIMGARLDLTG